MKQVKTFYQFLNNSDTQSKSTDLNESVDYDASDYGFTIDGEALQVHLTKARFNNTMNLEFKGNRIIPHLKSCDGIKDEYFSEEDFNEIERMYNKLSDKHAKEVAELVKEFEIKLNNLIVKFEEDIDKTFDL